MKITALALHIGLNQVCSLRCALTSPELTDTHKIFDNGVPQPNDTFSDARMLEQRLGAYPLPAPGHPRQYRIYVEHARSTRARAIHICFPNFCSIPSYLCNSRCRTVSELAGLNNRNRSSFAAPRHAIGSSLNSDSNANLSVRESHRSSQPYRFNLKSPGASVEQGSAARGAHPYSGWRSVYLWNGVCPFDLDLSR
jgi:hypothetical protein